MFYQLNELLENGLKSFRPKLREMNLEYVQYFSVIEVCRPDIANIIRNFEKAFLDISRMSNAKCFCHFFKILRGD